MHLKLKMKFSSLKFEGKNVEVEGNCVCANLCLYTLREKGKNYM